MNESTFTDSDLSSETTYHYAVTAVDNALNENSSVVSVSGYVPDLDPPELTITSPNEATYTNATQTIAFTVSGHESCTIRVKGISLGEVNSGIQHTFDEGQNTVEVECRDEYDNVVLKSVQVTIDTTPPNQITGLSVLTMPGENKLQLQWDNSSSVPQGVLGVASDFDAYHVYRSDEQFSDITNANEIAEISDETITSYEDTNLESGKSYYYAVAAVDTSGNMNVYVTSVSGTVADTLPPSKISGLTVTQSTSAVALDLSWDVSSEDDFYKYIIYFNEEPFIDSSNAEVATEIYNQQVTFYTDYNVESEVAMYYAITAVDTSGNEDTSVLSVGALPPDVNPPIIDILMPVNASTHGTNEVAFEFAVNEIANCTYSLNGDDEVILGSTSGSVMGLEGINALHITCTDESGNSGSNTVYFDVDTLPPAQVNIALSFINQSVVIYWDDTFGATSYEVYREQESFTTIEGREPIALEIVSDHSDFTIESDTTYYYAVVAVDEAQNKNPNVNVLSITTPDFTAPAPIENVQVTNVLGEDSLRISWDATNASDFSEYRVYKATYPFVHIDTSSIAHQEFSISTTEFVDVNLGNMQTYYYAVTAIDLNGNEEKTVVSVLGETGETQAPIVTVLNPLQSQSLKNPVHVHWEVDEEPQSCEYSLNGNEPTNLPLVKVTCQKYLGGYDFINYDDDPWDDHGHGTHCAGIAAGNGGNIVGVAPDAQLLGYKVLSSGGYGSWTSVINGIERAVADGADIMSLSLGGRGNPDDPASIALDNAVNAGVVAIVAAGNDGPGSGTIGSPGTSRNAITVGAIDKSYNIAYFSSRGPTSAGTKPDVVAPGVSIYSALPNNRYASWSGTSMATPHVAGVAALLLQANPEWTPEEVKSAMMNNAVDLGYDGNTQGEGMTDVVQILNAEGISQYTPSNDGAFQQAPISDSLPQPAPVSYAPTEKRKVIIRLDEKSITEKLAELPQSAPEFEKDSLRANQDTKLKQAQAAFAQELSKLGVNVEEELRHVMNALIVEVDESELAKIEELYGVVDVFEDQPVQISLDDSVPMISADDAWELMDSIGRPLTGKGLKIAIIDTGIDYTHPAFASADCGYEYEGSFNGVNGANELVVSCSDLYGNVGYSDPIQFTIDETAPELVTGLAVAAIPGVAGLHLHWDESNDADFSHYNVYRSIASFNSVEGFQIAYTISEQNTTNLTDMDGLISEDTYHYAITAVDFAGNENTAVVSASGTVADVIPPQPVGYVSVDPVLNEQELVVSWVANLDADLAGYNIYRSEFSFDLTLDAQRIAQVSALDTEYRDTGLETGKTYYYAVTAYDTNSNERTEVTSIEGTVDDLIAPEITVLMPENGEQFATPFVNLYWQTSEEAVQCEYSVNGGSRNPLPLEQVLCEKYIGGYDSVNGDNDPFDDHGHGTHCAGIAVGNGGNIIGVAPDAQLLAYKVLSRTGSGYMSWIIDGVDRAVADGADIISLSLGGFGSPTDPMAQAINNAMNAGVVATVAAGNSGPNSWTILSPGVAEHAITVGAVDKSRNIAYFSSRGPTSAGPKPDVVAPGVSIYSALPDNRYASWSGTSMATPHVAGVAALLLQANPEWDSFDVKNAIKNNAIDLGYDVNTQGTGFNDALHIIDQEGISSFGGVASESNEEPTHAQNDEPMQSAPDEKRRVIVVLEEHSVLESQMDNSNSITPDAQLNRINLQHADYVDSLNEVGLEVHEQFTHVINGFVTDATEEEMAFLRGLPGVKSVEEDGEVSLALDDSVPLVNADDVWNRIDAKGRSITGRGIKVAIIDTGVDYNHPALANAGAECSYDYTGQITLSDGVNNLQIYCSDEVGHEGVSDIVTVTVDTTAPDQIESLQVNSEQGVAALSLSWDASSAEDLVEYRVYRSTVNFDTINQAQLIAQVSSNTTTYSDTEVLSDTTYYYAVTGFDAFGNEQQNVIATPGHTPDLSAPTITITSPLTHNEVTYTTSTVQLTYTIDDTADCTYSLDGQGYYPAQSGMALNFNAALEFHTLNMSCVDDGNNEGTASVLFAVDVLPPSPVLGLSAALSDDKSYAHLSWSTSSDAYTYKVYRSITNFTNVTEATEVVEVSSTSFNDTSISSSTTYYYAVTSLDDHGNENTLITTVVVATPDTDAPEQIVGLSVTPVDETQALDLDWVQNNANDFATYTIYRSESPFTSVAQEEGEVVGSGSFGNVRGMFSQRRDLAAAPLPTGDVLVAGGYWSSALFGSGSRSGTEIITPGQSATDGKVTLGPNMVYKRRSLKMIALDDGRVLISGGQDGQNYPSLVEIFTPGNSPGDAGSLSSIDDPECTATIGRRAHTLTKLSDGKVLIAAGYSGTPVINNVAEVFDPTTNCITRVGDLTGTRAGHTATLLNDGRVLIAGGASFGVASAEIYDPATQSFTQTQGEMNVRRSSHQSVLMDDGRVFIVGGVTPGGPWYNSAEIYDPATDSFSLVSDTLSNSVVWPTLSVLSNTEILVIGGMTSSTSATKVVEIFNTETETFSAASIEIVREFFNHATAHFDNGQIYFVGGGTYGLPQAEMYYPPGIESSSAAEVIHTISDKSTVTYRDSGLVPGETYHYAVTAKDTNGNENTNVQSVAGTVREYDPPIVVVSQPLNGANYSEYAMVDGIYVELNVSEEVNSCEYSLNSGEYQPLVGSGSETNFYGTFTVVDGTYQFKARCSDLSGNLGESNTVTFTVDTIPPDVVSFNVTTLPGQTALRVEWEQTTADDFRYYEIYRSPTPFNSIEGLVSHEIISDADITQYTDTIVSSGNIYHYSVLVSDHVGNKHRDVPSKQGLVWNDEDHIPSQPEIIAPNGGEFFEPPNDESVSISWTNAIDPDGDEVTYNVSYTDDLGIRYFIGITTDTSLEWDTTQVPNGNYRVGVSATDGQYMTEIDESDSEFSLSHVPDDPPAPIEITTVVAPENDTTVFIQWASSVEEDVVQYKVYRETTQFNATEGLLAIATINTVNITQYLDTTTQAYTDYYYAVTAVDVKAQESQVMNGTYVKSGDNALPEIEFLGALQPYTFGTVNVSALVSDAQSGLDACEICITKNGNCDWELVFEEYVRGDTSGTCYDPWESEEYTTGEYMVQYRITDRVGNVAYTESMNTTVVDESSAVGVTIDVQPGWNLISLPIIPENSALSYVLSDVEGLYDKIYYYDAQTKLWYIHKPERSFFDPENTLFSLEPGKAYWLKMRTNAQLEIRGYELPEYIVPVYAGWNYIGYPTRINVPIDDALANVFTSVNVVYEYLPLEQRYIRYEPYSSYNLITHMRPGIGYAVEMTQDGTILVD